MSRVTITKRKGRYYVGCDAAALMAIYGAVLIAENTRTYLLRRKPDVDQLRVETAFKAYVEQIRKGHS